VSEELAFDAFLFASAFCFPPHFSLLWAGHSDQLYINYENEGECGKISMPKAAFELVVSMLQRSMLGLTGSYLFLGHLP
jgi:hypothetical protein